MKPPWAEAPKKLLIFTTGTPKPDHSTPIVHSARQQLRPARSLPLIDTLIDNWAAKLARESLTVTHPAEVKLTQHLSAQTAHISSEYHPLDHTVTETPAVPLHSH